MKSIAFFSFAVVVAAFFGGCSIREPRPMPAMDPAKMKEPKELLERQKEGAPLGPPPFTEKLEPVTKGLKKESRLFSLVFQEAPLLDILGAITKDSDLNLIVENGVDLSRPVTVNLKNVTFEEVLDMAVTRGAGFAWTVENGSLHIKRFEERVYHFDYLDIIGEMDIEVGGDMLASGIENPGVSGKYQLKAKRAGENTDVWSGIQLALEGLKSEEGVLRINRNAGVIYMADSPRRISAMVKFLDSLSESLHRQVFLEAKIVEVQLSNENKYGIDWSKLDIHFEGDVLDELDISFNSGGTIMLADQSRFAAVLDFLRTQGDVSVVSNPHIAVMNGQSAVMTVGYQFPYGDIEGVERDLESGTVTVDASIKRAILGLQLGITPRISDDSMITLHIVPTVTRIQREEKVELPTSATTVQAISNPVIDLQELSTTVRVREGRSIVLAGLISQITQLNHEGLPVLGNLPLINSLFKHVEETEESRELVIFVTPHILR